MFGLVLAAPLRFVMVRPVKLGSVLAARSRLVVLCSGLDGWIHCVLAARSRLVGLCSGWDGWINCVLAAPLC